MFFPSNDWKYITKSFIYFINSFLQSNFLLFWVQLCIKEFVVSFQWSQKVSKSLFPNPLWWVCSFLLIPTLPPNFQRNHWDFRFSVVLWFRLQMFNQSVHSQSLWLSLWFWESPRRATHSQWHFRSPKSLRMCFEFPFSLFVLSISL